MKRCGAPPRPDWQLRVERDGLLFHSVGAPGAPQTAYWAEGTYYELTVAEVETLEAATAELHALCLDAVEDVIGRRRYAEFGVSERAIPWIERSWREEPPSLYGRLDLAFGPDGVPKLLEYNADTPTSLLEGAVIQWTWLADSFPDADQFNSIHERLIGTWRYFAPWLTGGRVHFGFIDDLEDAMTVGYLRDTASQAGFATTGLHMDDIGWDPRRARFVDLEQRPIDALFKLYPWEGLVEDDFAPLIGRVPTLLVIEPAWKMLLSNKSLLPILWELFPDHPNLLPASREPLLGDWVRKPVLGREGSNVTVHATGVEVSTGGPYDSGAFVYQRYADLGEHDGMRPVIGSWLIGGEPAGIGIRETRSFVTDDTARFVPHLFWETSERRDGAR